VDSYLAHHIADGTFTALHALPAGPDQPQQAAGVEVTELADGLMVRPAGSPTTHQLNNTASVIFELCDGHRTVTQIAGAVAEAFGLAADPLAEVTACVAGLRNPGILADAIHYPAETRPVTATAIHHTAESSTP
jgi:Coenzyme PQQ synthesis protein D (PqqD)